MVQYIIVIYHIYLVDNAVSWNQPSELIKLNHLSGDSNVMGSADSWKKQLDIVCKKRASFLNEIKKKLNRATEKTKANIFINENQKNYRKNQSTVCAAVFYWIENNMFETWVYKITYRYMIQILFNVYSSKYLVEQDAD